MLPCNVIVYEEEGRTAIAVAGPLGMIGTLGDPRLDDVAREVSDRLMRMVEKLTN